MKARYPHTPMKSGRPVFLSIIALVIIAIALYPRMTNHDKQVLQLSSMIEGLKQYHFQPRTLDDEFSELVFDQFLGSLDGSKRFFTASEIRRLESHKTLIDDQINQRTFEFYKETIDKYRKSIDRTSGWYEEILSKPFDFNIKEAIETDAEKLAWADGEADLKERWRQQLKYEVLFRIYDKYLPEEDFPGEETLEVIPDKEAVEEEAEKSFEQLEKEARESILDRYNQWFKRMKKSTSEDYFSEYLNSIATVFDPHTQYFKPVDKENFDISMSGKLEGIGARLQTDKDDTKVVNVVPGGPAWKQKELEANDVIIKVGQGSEEAVVVTGMDINEVVALVRGKKGTEVRLTVKKVDGTLKTISIIRDEVILDEGFAKSLVVRTPSSGDKLGYIRLPRFYADFESKDGRACAADMALEIQKLKNENVKGIVIDLRNNGGGSLRDVVTMSGYFIEKGPIVQVKSRTGRASIHDDRDPSILWNGPLIIMVNEFSASASEIMAAAMQDYGRAVIVGSPATYGKGTVQRFFDLDNAIAGNNLNKPFGEVKLTIQNFYRINGGSTQLKGVIPDIILPDNYIYLDLGEKEYPHSLPFSEIDPLPYQQNVYQVDRYLDDLRNLSSSRIQQAPHFQKTLENANRFKAQSDFTAYPLQLDSYRTLMENRKLEADKYKDLYLENEQLTVMNPAADMAYIKVDSSRIVRNEDFITNIRKDMHLDETLRIMEDLIRLERSYVRTKK